MKKQKKEKIIIGWREWVALPDFGIHKIKAKVDTGARSSSIHAHDLKILAKGDTHFAKFKICPNQNDSKTYKSVKAKIIEYRKIKSSNGEVSIRPIIITNIQLMNMIWPIELSLADRDQMGFRMLLGRESFRKKMLVDADRSFYGKKVKTNLLY